MILGPTDLLKKYEDDKSKAWEDFFYQGYSIQEPKQDVVNMLNGMKRKSIFYELPYWKDLLIARLLDPMPIFKIVLDSIFRHISGKEKDTLSSRRDISLSRTKIDRKHLWSNMENETYAEVAWILEKKRARPTEKCHPFNKDTY